MLEIGCGSGDYLVHVIRSLPAAEVVGVDVSARALERAARAVGAQAQVRLVRAAAESLPLPAQAFDLVVANKSFHHWRDWGAGLGEARRVLRDDGTLIIADALAAGAMARPWRRRLGEILDGGGRFVDEQTFDVLLTGVGFALEKRISVPRSAGMLFISVAR